MATPAYPGAVKTFGADLENLVNIVYAAHVNDLRAEVVAVETEIGLGLRKSITWANRPTFDRPTSANFTWGDLSLRLINIEAGLVSSAVDIHPQYFLTTGGSLTGPINMGNNRISNLTYGEVNSDAVAMGQLNDVASVAYAARNLAESTSPIAQQALFLGQEALPRTGGTMTGNINMGGRYLLNIGQSGAVNDAATVGQVNAVANASLPRAGGAMSGDINMGWWNRVTALLAGASPGDAVNKSQLDAVANASLPRAGGAMSGDINMGGKYVLNIGQSGGANDAATVGQVNAVAGRAVGGVIVATTNGSGQISVTLPTSPTGNWSVTASAPAQFILVSVSGTTATFTVYALSGSGPTYPLVLLASDPTPLRIFYHAIAF